MIENQEQYELAKEQVRYLRAGLQAFTQAVQLGVSFPLDGDVIKNEIERLEEAIAEYEKKGKEDFDYAGDRKAGDEQ